jgi:hypothetical protein
MSGSSWQRISPAVIRRVATSCRPTSGLRVTRSGAQSPKHVRRAFPVTQLDYTLIKKKIKFSSYIRKFRVEQLQSHIWLTASSYMGKYLRISSYIRKPFLIYDFAPAPLLNFLIYEENFIFFFISVERQIKVLIKNLAIFFLFPSKEFLPRYHSKFSCWKLLPKNRRGNCPFSSLKIQKYISC